MKVFSGTVISDSMEKTVVVRVTNLWVHPIYKKRVKRTKKYLVHDEDNQAKVGDTIEFTESRPLSKRKRFILTKLVK